MSLSTRELADYKPKAKDYLSKEFSEPSAPFKRAVLDRFPVENKRGAARDVLYKLLKRDRVFITSETMQLADLWMRQSVPGIKEINRRYRQVFADTEKVLEISGINHHDPRHMNTVSNWGVNWGLVHNAPEHQVKVAALAARYHDNYKPYLLLPREKLESLTDKHMFDEHPLHAANEFQQVMESQAFADIFAGWSEADRHLALQTILQHSNGSFAYDEVKEQLPLAVKTGARGPDKLDNIFLRAHEHALRPEKLPDTKKRKDYVHKITPFATRNQFMEIDKLRGTCTVHYVVDLAETERHTGEKYTQKQHIENFPKAYLGSMQRAAEVAETAFATEGIGIADKNTFFSVQFHFVRDGKEISRHTEHYAPLSTQSKGHKPSLTVNVA